MKKYIIGVIAAAVMLAAQAAASAPAPVTAGPPSTKYQQWLEHRKALADNAAAVQTVAKEAEKEQAVAQATLAGRMDSKDALIASIVSEFNATIRVALSKQAAAQPVQLDAPPPAEPPPCEGGCAVKAFLGGLFGGLVDLGKAVAVPIVQGRYSYLASVAATAASRDVQLGAQAATTRQFEVLGGTSVSIANGGFAMGSTALQKPSSVVNINGDGNGVGVQGGTGTVQHTTTTTTNTTTNTNQCPGGNGGAGGSGGNPAAAGAGGVGGVGGVSGATECKAGSQ